MNEQLVMGMVEHHVNEGRIEYQTFAKIFGMLNDQEKDDAEQILEKNGIEILPDMGAIQDCDNDSQFFDEELFKDSTFNKDINSSVVFRKNIKQSNEILCHLIQQGNKQAEQDLCVKNKRLVCKYAYIYMKRYKNLLDFEDLEQVGFMGLLTASQKYKVELGYQFSTYATWWIIQAISREIMNKGHIIRIPVHLFEKMNTVARLEHQYLKLGLNERVRKIVEETSFSEEEVRKILSLITNVFSYVSLNTFIHDEEKHEFIESVETIESESIEDILSKLELERIVKTVLMNLNEKEQEIIKLRYGIGDKKADSKTLEFIGRKFNVTRERIRQLENSILKKLTRSMLRIGKFEDFVG